MEQAAVPVDEIEEKLKKMKMKNLTKFRNLAATAVVCTIFSSATFAQNEGPEQEVLEGEALPVNMANPYDDGKGPDLNALAEELNNPVSDLWFLAVQNDTTSYKGDFDGGDSRTFNSFKLQPVMSIPLGDNYNLIVRPILQYLTYDYPGISLDDPMPPITENSFGLDFDNVDGMGDTILMTSVGRSDQQGGLILAAGPTFMFPTASEDELAILQQNKWAAGPSLIGIYIGDQWIVGAVAQHWWGIGNSTQKLRVNIPANSSQLNVEVDGDNLNLTDIQYVLRYRYSAQTNIGMAPNISINWNASGSDKYTVPVGMGMDTMVMLGPLPVKMGFEVQYYVNQPDAFGPDVNFRLFFVPIVPSPFGK